jgi:hypothetical protein
MTRRIDSSDHLSDQKIKIYECTAILKYFFFKFNLVDHWAKSTEKKEENSNLGSNLKS